MPCYRPPRSRRNCISTPKAATRSACAAPASRSPHGPTWPIPGCARSGSRTEPAKPGEHSTRGLRPRKPDLVDLRPALAGDEQALALGVPGDAVQDVVGGVGGFLGFGAEAGEVDPAHYVAAGRVDPCDARSEPHIGVELAFHPLQLVE